MKVLRLTLDSLRIDLGSFAVLFFGFLIFPLFMSQFLIYANSVEASDVQPKLKIEFQDEDQSEISKLYIKMFQSSGIIEEDKKSDYVLTLPQGFSDSILSADPEAAPELNDDAGSGTGKSILKILHDSFSSSIRRQFELNDAVSRSGIGEEESQKLLIQAAGLEAKVGQMIQTEILDTTGRDRKQTVRDNIAMGYLGFIILMFSVNIPGSDTKARKTGLDRRVHSTPTRRGTITIANYIEYSSVATLIMLAYIVIQRFGGSFNGSVPLHLLIAVCFSLIFSAGAMLLTTIVPKPEYSSLILTLLLMIQSFGVSFGGVSGSQELSGLAGLMNKYRPDKAMLQMMERNATGTLNRTDFITLGALVLGAIILISISAFLQNKKKEIIS